MKNLDLNQLGVQEMTNEEMATVDGGIFEVLLGVAVGYAVEGLWECCKETHRRGTLANASQGVWLWG